jgi:hypothetical protein
MFIDDLLMRILSGQQQILTRTQVENGHELVGGALVSATNSVAAPD